jgi:hypothetical protein
MIRGIKFWNDPAKYTIQSNNAVETYNKTQRAEGLNHWTESCGPSSAVNILEAMGHDINVKVPGAWLPQPEDVLFLWMNDPKNAPSWGKYCPWYKPNSLPGNRIPHLYIPAVFAVFGQRCAVQDGLAFDQVSEIVNSGQGVQVCLVNPGHFIPLVAFDDQAQEFIYNDPFPERHPGGSGFNSRLTRKEFESNLTPHFIIFS